MKITELLHIIAMSKGFEITEDECFFYIEHSESNVAVCIAKNNGSMAYKVSGCYNSGTDWVNIDPRALDELREFVSYLETEAEE